MSCVFHTESSLGIYDKESGSMGCVLRLGAIDDRAAENGKSHNQSIAIPALCRADFILCNWDLRSAFSERWASIRSCCSWIALLVSTYSG